MSEILEVYGYQISGNILNLYEKDYMGAWIPPEDDRDDGLKIDYITANNVFVDSSGIPAASPTENSYVNMNESETEALVAYIKFKLYEEAGKIDLASYHEDQYRRLLSRAANAMKPSGFKVTPHSPYAIR